MADSSELRIKRGAEADRSGVTPAAGEPLWTTDEKRLYIGDGSTAGGVAVAGPPFDLPRASGDYFPGCIPTSATTTGNPGANSFIALPFFLAESTSFDRIAIEVTGSTGAGSCRLGIYTSGADGLPDARVVGTASFSLAGNGIKAQTIAETLAPGWHWTALVTNAGAVGFRLMATGGGLAILSPGAGSFSAAYNIRSAFSFAALPASAASAGTLRGSELAAPYIALRVA